MNRTLLNDLSENPIISFNERPGITFRITDVIGRGASCVVYHAVCSDATEHLLKEYYPKDLTLNREASGQISVPIEKQSAFEAGLVRFRAGCERQKAIRLSNGLKNFTCNIQGYYRANGTEYIDMTCFNGQTYDCVQEKSVYDLMIRMRTLAQVVGNYHKAGLLHLDIKPENIYVRPEEETVEDVMLFDFDSVVAMQDLLMPKALSCTKTWAAPEQLLPEKRRKICPATDLFAIGEMIFVQLVGRHSSNAERRSFVTSYSYDRSAAVFANINPKVFPRLDDLLSHSICGIVENRYQSAEELIVKIEEIVHLSDPKEPYLKSSMLTMQEFFVGRENEIEEIHRKLSEDRILFLNGIGGIGKSELVKRYADAHKDAYDTIMFAPYVSDVDMLIQDDIAIPLYHFAPYPEEKPEEYCARKLKKLMELCDERTLLIVDNLDRDDDPGLKKLLDLGAKLLITTRMDFEEYGIGQQLSLDALHDRAEIRRIFDKYYTKPLSAADESCVEQIIDLVAGHTMTVELLAKQMMAGRVKPEKMLAKLQEGGISESGKEKVRSGKDGVLSARSAYSHIQTLFDLSGLNEDERYILANLSLMPYTGISTELFHDWCELEDYECINRLVVQGWIRLYSEKDAISLHPVVVEMAACSLNHDAISLDKIIRNALLFCEKDSSISLLSVYTEMVGKILKLEYISSDAMDLLCGIPALLSKYGNQKLMLRSAEKSLEMSTELFDENHPKVAETLYKCGSIYIDFDKFDIAELAFRKALQILSSLADVKKEEIAEIYNSLGVLNGKREKYAEAEQYLQLSLDYFVNCSEDKKEEISTVYDNLGSHYLEVNCFDKAKEYYMQALEMRKSIFGEIHNDTALSYHNLGGFYMELGDYDLAKEYFSKALDIRLAIFEEDNLDISATMGNLGAICYYQGDYEGAKCWWLKCQHISAKLLGEGSSQLGVAFSNLGVLCYASKEYEEAELYYQKALKIFLDIYGEKHGKVADIYSNLGNLYCAQGRLEDAERCHNLALRISESIYGNQNDTLAYRYYNAGILKAKQQKFSEAKTLLERALMMYTNIYGENYPDVQETQEELNKLQSLIATNQAK